MNGIDLNLLTAFEALLAERSVTRAAQRLAITQPAMSNALRRLRELLRDPVFVRTPEGMQPTPRALALGPTIETALRSIRGSLHARSFEPERSSAQFVIATLDYMEALYLPRLVAKIEATSPGVRVLIRRLPAIFDVPQASLASGAIDCALSLFPQPLTPQSSLHGEICGQEEWVCIARRGHPAFRRRLSLQAYARLRHFMVAYPDSGGPGLMDRILATQGLTRSCPVSVPHFSSLPFHVAQSDCIATVPRRLALRFAKLLPLQIAAAPAAIRPSDIALVWHTRVEADEAHVWFRRMVLNAMKAVTEAKRKALR